MANNYVVIIEKQIQTTALVYQTYPGCITVGATPEEAKTSMEGAMLFHIKGMQEDAIEIPAPRTQAVTLLAAPPKYDGNKLSPPFSKMGGTRLTQKILTGNLSIRISQNK